MLELNHESNADIFIFHPSIILKRGKLFNSSIYVKKVASFTGSGKSEVESRENAAQQMIDFLNKGAASKGEDGSRQNGIRPKADQQTGVSLAKLPSNKDGSHHVIQLLNRFDSGNI